MKNINGQTSKYDNKTKTEMFVCMMSKGLMFLWDVAGETTVSCRGWNSDWRRHETLDFIYHYLLFPTDTPVCMLLQLHSEHAFIS